MKPNLACRSILTVLVLSAWGYGGDLKSAGRHGSLAKKQVRLVGTTLPRDLYYAGLSSHYGVLICMNDEGVSKIYQVVASPKKSND